MILSFSDLEAKVCRDICFEDEEPIEDIMIVVPAKNARCIRMDNPAEIGGVRID